MRGSLYILAGIPATGKSTWAKHMFKQAHIVSSDEIRLEMYGSLKAAHEAKANAKVFKEYHDKIDQYLDYGEVVVADATSLNGHARATLRHIASKHEAEVHLVLFVDIVEARDRNHKRGDDEKVPEDVMRHMVTKYRQTSLALMDGEAEKYTSVTKIISADFVL